MQANIMCDFKWHGTLAILVILFVSICNARTSCSNALENNILTCEGLQLPPSGTKTQMNTVAEQITNETIVLILKNSPKLELTGVFHSRPFESLNSYQIVNAQSLKIAPKTFSKLTELEYMKICDNRYSTVETNTFHALGKLKLLNLNNNSIQSLQEGAFNDLDALETLEMTHNDFKVLHRDIFNALASLKSLFLYHNNIEVLQDGCLNGLQRLNVLDLTYNRIVHINADTFNALPITQLYLSYNLIEDVVGSFTLKNLEFLYLQNNKLRVVGDLLFSSMSTLLDVDISRNKIAELSPLAFFNCTKLANLNYKENALKQRVDFEFAANATEPLITA